MELRESILLGGILYATEALTNITEEEIEIVTKVDNDFLVELMEVERTVGRAILRLELGVKPIKIKIMTRRILLLQSILKMEEGSLLLNMVVAQRRSPSKDDWILQVQKDMKSFNLSLSDQELVQMSKEKLKKILKMKEDALAFIELNNSRKKTENNCGFIFL